MSKVRVPDQRWTGKGKGNDTRAKETLPKAAKTPVQKGTPTKVRTSKA